MVQFVKKPTLRPIHEREERSITNNSWGWIISKRYNLLHDLHKKINSTDFQSIVFLFYKIRSFCKYLLLLKFTVDVNLSDVKTKEIGIVLLTAVYNLDLTLVAPWAFYLFPVFSIF